MAKRGAGMREVKVPRALTEWAEQRVSYLLQPAPLFGAKYDLRKLLSWAYFQGLEDAVQSLDRIGAINGKKLDAAVKTPVDKLVELGLGEVESGC
jgi:hypothetical protein